MICSITHDILGDPFWEVYNRGVTAARDRFECDVRIMRPKCYSPVHMCTLVESAVRDRPDGLLCTIPDAAALDQPLRAAISAGIAVIASNAMDPRGPAERIPYLLYIGAKDRDAGALAGRRLLRAGAGLEVICFDHYQFEQSCHSERFTGLRDTIVGQGGSCRRIAIRGDDHDDAIALVRAVLDASPTVDAIVTLGPPGAQAALRAMEASARTLRHITFDLSEEQLAALRDGRLLAIVDSQQYLQGFIGVQLLCLYLKHGLLPTSDILTGPALVDASNVAAAECAFRMGVR